MGTSGTALRDYHFLFLAFPPQAGKYNYILPSLIRESYGARGINIDASGSCQKGAIRRS